jgi:hypothetical protein
VRAERTERAGLGEEIAVHWSADSSNFGEKVHDDVLPTARHVLPKGLHKVRYFGLWHPAKREDAARARLLLLLDRQATSRHAQTSPDVAEPSDEPQKPDGPRVCPCLIWAARVVGSAAAAGCSMRRRSWRPVRRVWRRSIPAVKRRAEKTSPSSTPACPAVRLACDRLILSRQLMCYKSRRVLSMNEGPTGQASANGGVALLTLRILSSLKQSLRDTQIGRLARMAGLGRFLLWLTWEGYHRRNLFGLGLMEYARFISARRAYLKCIIHAAPLIAPVGPPVFEVHMLLNHARILEGAWALYSFHRTFELSVRTVIHDDGTLSDTDIALLQSIFRPLTIWRRATADAICNTRLMELGFERLVRLRKAHVFGLKLVDPVLLGETSSIVLLDSDILFFNQPTELLRAAVTGSAVYSVDTLDSYCLPNQTMSAFVGESTIHRCCAGLLGVDRTQVDLSRWNDYLSAPEFWNHDGSADYHAEQTLWAMELTRLGAGALPCSYAICPPDPPAVHCGHYNQATAAEHALFYTAGLPYLRSVM